MFRGEFFFSLVGFPSSLVCIVFPPILHWPGLRPILALAGGHYKAHFALARASPHFGLAGVFVFVSFWFFVHLWYPYLVHRSLKNCGFADARF